MFWSLSSKNIGLEAIFVECKTGGVWLLVNRLGLLLGVGAILDVEGGETELSAANNDGPSLHACNGS
jgi:hypothetical protein